MSSREPDRSPVVMTQMVLPSHTNALGTIFGGVVMAWIDIAGAIAARRYARSDVVTVSVDHIHFIAPIKTGFTVTVTGRVTASAKTSMEVEVLVDSENSILGEVRRTTKAYLTFVAVDEFGKPKPVPKFTAQNETERKELEAAKVRRKRRLEWSD